ncbi:unnamed protein product [Adineta ricciae]|uniref:NHL repeat containing protein-like protein n=1 Tax=Adineta ricciae TaxID=249248 RepID=A0A814XQS5_ADIRI|nr:unnamed protein product [Adineta ricciae]
MSNLNVMMLTNEDLSPSAIKESTGITKVLRTLCIHSKKKILLALFILIILVALITTLGVVLKKRNVKKITLTIDNATMQTLTKSGETSAATENPSITTAAENPSITTATKDPCPSRGFRWNTEGITVGIDLSPKLSCSRLFIDSNDTLYGVDNTKAYVWKLSKNDTNAITVAGIYGTKGQSSFRLENPQDVYVDQYGDIYVVDTNNHRIQKFINGSMEGITILGNGAIDDARRFRLQYPRNFAFESTEKFMYVAVHGNQNVLGFFTNRTVPAVPSVIAGNGTSGNTIYQLNGPWGIYLLPPTQNIVFVTNYDGHSVMRFSPGKSSGTFVAGIRGFSCSNSSCLHNPTDVKVDDNSTMYVVDSSNHRVQMFCQNKRQGTTIIGNGIPGNKSTQLSQPQGIAFDSAMNMYICDTGNHRVQKFLRL